MFTTGILGISALLFTTMLVLLELGRRRGLRQGTLREAVRGIAVVEGAIFSLLRLLAQKPDAQPRALPGGLLFRPRVDFMVAQAAENAGVGAQPGQLPQAGAERIAGRGDQVAGHQRQVRAQLVGHGDGAGQFPLAQERAQMNIAELCQPQPLKILRQVRDRHRNHGVSLTIREGETVHEVPWRSQKGLA